jgi:hypothetical protein
MASQLAIKFHRRLFYFTPNFMLSSDCSPLDKEDIDFSSPLLLVKMNLLFL